MKANNTDHFYDKPDEYLEQGDIFQIDLVAPGADETKRIFRTTDGQHGSVFFGGGCQAKVFDQDELEELLSNISRTELHVNPFCKTPDRQDEMVIVEAQLFQYFIIGTQTCDISGREGHRPPRLWATIFPVRTLASQCRTISMPFKTGENLTIHQFVCKYWSNPTDLENANDADYGATLRIIIDDWRKQNPTKKIGTSVGQVKTFLSEYHKKGYLFPLPDDVKLSVPECIVDFTTAYTVHRAKLLKLQDKRVARLIGDYRTRFAQGLTNFFARVATMRPMEPGIPK